MQQFKENDGDHKKLSWRNKTRLDVRLSNLLSGIEEKWFGPWIHLLLEDCNHIDSSVVIKLKADLKSMRSFDAHENILKLAIVVAMHASQRIDCSSNLVLKKGCYIGSNNVHEQSPMGLRVSGLILDAVNESKDQTGFIRAEPIIFVSRLLLFCTRFLYQMRHFLCCRPLPVLFSFFNGHRIFIKHHLEVVSKRVLMLNKKTKDKEASWICYWDRPIIDEVVLEFRSIIYSNHTRNYGDVITHSWMYASLIFLDVALGKPSIFTKTGGLPHAFFCPYFFGICQMPREEGPYRPKGAPLEYLDTDLPIIVGYL